jgi:site-specific recombinase XerD
MPNCTTLTSGQSRTIRRAKFGIGHTFCSWLAMAGASIEEIQEAAGHKTITMSASYSHLLPTHKLSVIERIAAIGC